MRLRTAALTLGAPLSIGLAGVLGFGAPLRAEPITIQIVEPTPERITGFGEAGVKWPPEVGSLTSGAGDAGRNDAADDHAPPAPPAATHPHGAQGESAAPQVAVPTTESLAAAIAVMDGDWSWDRQLREAARPLYDELAGSALADVANNLKSYLDLIAKPSEADLGGAHEPASWELDRQAPQRSAAQLDKDGLLAVIMFDELIDALKPWLVILTVLYLLWQTLRLWLNYLRWKSTRKHRRGSRKTRSLRSASRRVRTPETVNHRLTAGERPSARSPGQSRQT